VDVTDQIRIDTRIEAIRVADTFYGTASARQIVLRFGFRAPAGTYCVWINNSSAPTRSFIAPFTITAGQANTDTEQTFVIPGDTTGTWRVDTFQGMGLSVVVMAGSNWHGSAGWQAGNKFATSAITNGAATVGNTFELFDVGLYLDPANTGKAPDWTMPDEAEELRACQRYYEIFTPGGFTFSGNVTSASNYVIGAQFRVNKRVAPAVTGVASAASGFPNTAGTFQAPDTGSVREMRTANSTSAGQWQTTVTINARM
jgi:hypothetical protein